MVDRIATYLVEVYGTDEALEFATRAVAENRARDRPASVAEWERVVMVLRDPERVAEIVRDLERVSNPPEHAAWCGGPLSPARIARARRRVAINPYHLEIKSEISVAEGGGCISAEAVSGDFRHVYSTPAIR